MPRVLTGTVSKEPPGGLQDEPADHALGRSRGGLTTKTHLACEQGQKPVAMLLTAGQRKAKGSKGRPTTRLRFRRLPATTCRGVRYQPTQRHRGMATRYDKLAVRYQATLTIAVIGEWL